MTRKAFETNIPELTRRLGLNLYNDPMVAIRELTQNANDACILGEGFHALGRGRIDLNIDEDGSKLIVRDTGIGMTEDDLHLFLSTIASSKKTELRKQLDDQHFEGARGIAGQFGIGFLSTFIIADSVEIKTRHQRERGPGSVWISAGDGFYDVNPSASNLDRGTTVILHVKKEFRKEITASKVSRALVKACPFIRTPYFINNSILPANHEPPPWEEPQDAGLAASYLRSCFNLQPLIGFYINHNGPVLINDQSVQRVRVSGYLAIPDAKLWLKSPSVYTSGLFVGEFKGLPSWARFFVGGIESPDLDLTLGRDNVMKNVTWLAVQKVIEEWLTDSIVKDLQDQRSRLRERWDAVFKIHAEDIMRAGTEDSQYGAGQFYRAVRDLIPFRLGNEHLSIRDAIKQGKCIQANGNKMLFYHSRGFRSHESAGIQEALLFDENNLSFIDARNYYERDFLQQYGKDSKDIKLVPVEDGLSYILDFNCDPRDSEAIIEIYKSLNINAKLARFRPGELSAVIIPLSSQDSRRAPEIDPATPEGREQFMQYLVSATDHERYKPYTLCLNVNNVLVQELLKYVRKHGIDSYIKTAFNQIYYMSVLIFGDTNTSVIARMAPGLSSLMLSFIRRSTEQENELLRIRHLLQREQERAEEAAGALAGREAEGREPNTVFLAYGYDKETVELVALLRSLLEAHQIKIIDGRVDKAGSLSRQIIDRIRHSAMFVGILTPRDQIKGQKKSITSIWVVEEKGVATAFGLPVLMIVDAQVASQFYGNIEGDAVRLEVSSAEIPIWHEKFKEAVQVIMKTLSSTKRDH